MGEIADDHMDGACCCWCGEYFEKEHGLPTLCGACWEDASEEERKEYLKAEYSTI